MMCCREKPLSLRRSVAMRSADLGTNSPRTFWFGLAQALEIDTRIWTPKHANGDCASGPSYLAADALPGCHAVRPPPDWPVASFEGGAGCTICCALLLEAHPWAACDDLQLGAVTGTGSWSGVRLATLNTKNHHLLFTDALRHAVVGPPLGLRCTLQPIAYSTASHVVCWSARTHRCACPPRSNQTSAPPARPPSSPSGLDPGPAVCS